MTTFFAIAEVVNTIDGDTFTGRIKAVSSHLETYKNKPSVGNIATFRLAGLNAPEISKETREYEIRYKLEEDQTKEVGKESKEYLSKLINKKEVIIEFDLESEGTIYKDKYDRYVVGAMTSVHNRTHKQIVEGEAGNALAFSIHINKSMLMTRSTKYNNVPLALPYFYFLEETPYSRLNISKWLIDLNIIANKEEIFDIQEKIEVYEDRDKEKLDFSEFEIKYEEPYDNRLNFFEGLDDRLEEIYPLDDIKEDSRVRIGDVVFNIPPIAIQMSRHSDIRKVKTLRTRSSIMTKTGSSDVMLSLQLYFHDMDEINGKKTIDDKGNVYYMDGLRTLLAQFKKTPFLPIENYHINANLDIHSVGLISMSANTVPGFPESIMVELQLAKFDHQAFMPHVPFLKEAINYPLMRWYYQSILTDETKEDYLPPIEGKLDGAMTFSIADEEELENKMLAIEKLRQLEDPLITKDKIENKKTEMGRRIFDGKKAEEALNTYNKFLSLSKQEKEKMIEFIEENPGRWMLNEVGSSEIKTIKSKWIEEKKAISSTDDAHVIVNPQGYLLMPISSILSIEEIEKRLEEQPLAGNTYAQLDSLVKENPLKGYIEVSTINDMKIIALPINQTGLETATRVRDIAIEAASVAENQLDEYYKTLEETRKSEDELSLNMFNIRDMIVLDLSVVFENNMSKINLQNKENPTLQYLGSQDPYIKIEIEGTDDTVQDVQEMLSKVDEIARKYRTGITSGFMGIDNELTKMFGVKTVLPEFADVKTIPGFPGRHSITLHLIGFDKTQSKQEVLEGLNATGSDVELEDLHVKNGNMFKAENAIIEAKISEMESYPDLGLPTYEELNAALPRLNAGFSRYAKTNKKAKYVEPDFYISTEWTMREAIRESRVKKQETVLRDDTGLELYTSPSSASAFYAKDDEMLERFKRMDEETERVVADDEDAEIKEGSLNKNGLLQEGGSGFQTEFDRGKKQYIDELYQLMHKDGISFSEIDEIKENPTILFEKPTTSEIIKWGYSASDLYKKFAVNSPSEKDVLLEIEKWVDTLWVRNKKAFDDKNNTRKNISDITFASNEDLFKARYLYEAEENPEMLEDYQYEFKDPSKEDKNKITWKALKETKGLVTRGRVINKIKAILHNNLLPWKQIGLDGKPVFNKETTQVGISGLSLNAFMTGINQARRLSWDWKYNLKTAIYFMYSLYLDAEENEDIHYKLRALDWMVYGYGAGKVPKKKEDVGKIQSTYFLITEGIGDKYYYKKALSYATPTSPYSDDIKSSSEKDLIKEMKNKYPKKYIIEMIGRMGSRVKKSKEDLDKMSWEEVRDVYINAVDGMDNHNSSYSGLGGNISAREGYDDLKKTTSGYLEDRREEEIENVMKLINDYEPGRLYHDMFVDMLEYDHKGRMLRAFPTFKMYIIDEGEFMSNYKLWDNLYGYNSIVSIDVHKSKRIAADTAVIEMTNIYSNLTAEALNTSYGDWSYSFWDNLILGKPSENIIELRKRMLDSMMLKTGARIHLRMGYGSSTQDLPTMFNGTITELSTGEVVQMVAQGDGLELSNIISGDPGEDNKGLIMIEEPRDTICELLTSRGNWFKDAINYTTDGAFFKDHPLGVQHFGLPAKTPDGNIIWFNSDYGEAAQNIYSSNGSKSFSQWHDANGDAFTFKWGETSLSNFFQPGDEDNVKVSYYNASIWDVANTLAYAHRDYMVAVHPFEMRSTLFFGKPYYRMAYRYNSTYRYDNEKKSWRRNVTFEHRKPYMQLHVLTESMDIISNSIRASEEGVFTNVIVNYDGKQSDTCYADYDIKHDRQKTTIIDASIKKEWVDFYFSKPHANNFGVSAVRDYMKEMYKGTLVTMGNPSIKPHDMCYMDDEMNRMNGNFLVGSVAHHLSQETGFITSIEPDAVAVSDDLALLSVSSWANSMWSGIVAGEIGRRTAAVGLKRLLQSPTVASGLKQGRELGADLVAKRMTKTLDNLDGAKDFGEDFVQYKKSLQKYTDVFTDFISIGGKANITDVNNAYRVLENSQDVLSAAIEAKAKVAGYNTLKGKKLISSMKSTKHITTGLKVGRKITSLKNVGLIFGVVNPVALIAQLIGTVVVEGLLEHYRRKKELLQCVIVSPLQYHGRNYTAGINGHAGMVVGDNPGKMDDFMNGAGVDGEKDFVDYIMNVVNFMANAEETRSVTEEDLVNWSDF